MTRWLKFNLIGVLGFAVQSGALYALARNVQHLHYLLATAIAVELAVLHNFVWHQRWTWRDRPCATVTETLRRLANFNITNGLVSITGNLLLMSMFVGWLGMPVNGGNLLSVAACSLCNFLLADRIVFDKPV
ncbi:MAG: GtrA family protein [Pyrinomonadaceae bacterium]